MRRAGFHSGRQSTVLAALFLFVAVGNTSAETPIAESPITALKISPQEIALSSRDARQQLLATGFRAEAPVDLTRKATYRSLTPAIVEVSPAGVASPVADGHGEIAVSALGHETRVKVSVRNAARQTPISFELDIEPILTKASCNAGACHGKQRGQNGFQLSLLGFDPDFDHAALTREARGRRIFPASPEKSLLLAKATGQEPHGGGRRIDPNSPAWETLRRWIAEGASRELAASEAPLPVLDRITVEPAERILAAREDQQLLVTAFYSDGTRRDVTPLAAYLSNEAAIVAVDKNGLAIAGPIPGESAIMARYMGKIAVANVAIPLVVDSPRPDYANLPKYNFIDPLVWAKLERLGLAPSAPANDATFLRRVHIDLIGRLPTPAEVQAFLADSTPDKRTRLVDQLLARPEYADHWANKWADLLRPNPYRVGIKAVMNYDVWIRDSFRQNKPYDAFVRELLTAQGSTWRNGAVTLFRDRRSPDELATITSQLFLGVRLECAKCHHHPFEIWGQEHFYSFAAYFARVGHKGQGVSPPISGGEEIILVKPAGTVSHPLTGKVLEPRPLFGTAPAIPSDGDPRESLAAWITSDDNHYFAQVIANRLWADLMGRGIVDPVDDLRGTNPPSNGPLLEALAKELRTQKYDLKKLLRAITTSYVYGLSSTPNERNLADTRNYSRHYRERLRAEVLLDAVSDITGVAEKFEAMPPDSRAAEIWTHRTSSLFLDAFGRPDPNLDPPCERTGGTTLVQALHLMNSPKLFDKATSDASRAAKLAASDAKPEAIVEELYLLTYNRPATAEERAACVALYAKPNVNRRKMTEDLLWALLNTPEFVFKD